MSSAGKIQPQWGGQGQEEQPTEKSALAKALQGERGRIGYLIAWLFGVPVSVLFLIFLVRGH